MLTFKSERRRGWTNVISTAETRLSTSIKPEPLFEISPNSDKRLLVSNTGNALNDNTIAAAQEATRAVATRRRRRLCFPHFPEGLVLL